jgi:hypothetical protein
MNDNYTKANDKILARAEAQLEKGRANVQLTAPREAGAYVVKVLVVGAASTGAGHASLEVPR